MDTIHTFIILLLSSLASKISSQLCLTEEYWVSPVWMILVWARCLAALVPAITEQVTAAIIIVVP